MKVPGFLSYLVEQDIEVLVLRYDPPVLPITLLTYLSTFVVFGKF